MYRVKGELLLQSLPQRLAAQGSDPRCAAAEVSFHQALDNARQQQAKALELRAALSLSRLWQQQDQRVEAAALLAPISYWFTEGLDTADLQEARTLLDALGRQGETHTSRR